MSGVTDDLANQQRYMMRIPGREIADRHRVGVGGNSRMRIT